MRRTELDGDIERERGEIVERLQRWLEVPMVVLGFVWLALLVVELVVGEVPYAREAATVIWIIFIADFALRLSIAPRRWRYLRDNWLTLIALAVPALRAFRVIRVLRVVRAARGVRLLRIVTSVNRGMRALGSSLSRRGFGYVVALTVLVTVSGAAGMYAFERGEGPEALNSYSEALWWTAMLMTTMGSEYWPSSPEGRLLCLLLSVFAFAVFGYVTATLASFFVGRDAEAPDAEVAGAEALRQVQAEVGEMRRSLQSLVELQRNGGDQRGG